MFEKKFIAEEKLSNNIQEMGVITLDKVVKCFWEDTPYILKIGENLVSLPHLIQQEIFWKKFCKFVMGIKSDSTFEEKFSKKITNGKDRDDYAKRIVAIIDKIEEEQKVDYIINGTRAFCWDQINQNEYFRICRAINNVYIDDLKFVLENYSSNYFAEDITVTELTNNGLMYQGIIDGGSADPNYIPKTHLFTPFGKLVYDMALNYDKLDLLQ